MREPKVNLRYNLDMPSITNLEPIDYLIIGHLTIDNTPSGPQLGGTATYTALTAQVCGLRVGILTAWGTEINSGPLESIPILNINSGRSTNFENIETPSGRVQHIFHVASRLESCHIPEPWRRARIVHLGPVAQEVEPTLVHQFPTALIGVTPQGWLRGWDEDGQVYVTEWPASSNILKNVGAAVISIDDLDGDEGRVEEMAVSCPVLAVTEEKQGVRLYWNGDVRRFRSPEVETVDRTGAGDIFAAAFFVRLFTTRDPWEAARFAIKLASFSVTRTGLAAIPTASEVNECLVEVI
jgi:sugar/nucleoside kinase (ribokinase family)